MSLDVDRGEVHLIDVAGVAFDEPFYAQTIRRALQSGAEQRVASVSASIPAAVARPAGLIFHVGRCGSTLLSRALGATGVFSVREPELLHPLLRNPAPVTAKWVSSLFGYFLQIAAVRNIPLVVKLSSHDGTFAHQLASGLVDPRIVLLTRSPEESVASLLSDPPRWSRVLYDEGDVPLAGRSVHVVNPQTAAEIYAEQWRRGVEAVRAVGGTDILEIDYDDLVRDLVGVVDRVRGWLALSRLDERQRRAVVDLATRDSKSSEGAMFEGISRPTTLSAPTALAVRRVVSPFDGGQPADREEPAGEMPIGTVDDVGFPVHQPSDDDG